MLLINDKKNNCLKGLSLKLFNDKMQDVLIYFLTFIVKYEKKKKENQIKKIPHILVTLFTHFENIYLLYQK